MMVIDTSILRYFSASFNTSLHWLVSYICESELYWYTTYASLSSPLRNGRGAGLSDGVGVSGIFFGVNDGRLKSNYEWKDKGVDFYEQYGREDACFRFCCVYPV